MSLPTLRRHRPLVTTEISEDTARQFAAQRMQMEAGQRALLSATFNLPGLIQTLLGDDTPEAIIATAGSHALGEPTSDGLGRQYQLEERTLLIHRPFEHTLQIIVDQGQDNAKTHTMFYQDKVTVAQVAELKGFYVLATSSHSQAEWTSSINMVLNPTATKTADVPQTPTGTGN